MTPAQIDSRLTVLETRIAPEEPPTIFVKLLSSLTDPVDGWSHDGFTYWRMPGESDDMLFSRVKESIVPMPGVVVKLRQMQRGSY
jgi:hypothetical protein